MLPCVNMEHNYEQSRHLALTADLMTAFSSNLRKAVFLCLPTTGYKQRKETVSNKSRFNKIKYV